MIVNMKTILLKLLLFIASASAAQCPGSFRCEKREVYSTKSLYVHYGIINEQELYAEVLEAKEDAEIIQKMTRYWPKMSDLVASPKNKTVLGAAFVQCQFTETTALSDAVSRIFGHVNISKLKIESSSFGDVSSTGYNDGDSPMTKKVLEDFKGLQELSLIDNNMNYIEDDFFEGFSNLKKLSLNNSEMTKIPSKLFEPLVNLEHIDLSYNKFSTLPSTLLRNNTKLETFLMLNNDQFIPSFPGGFFKNLTNLKEIKIINSRVMQLSGDLFEGTTGLKKLDLSKNHIFYLPPKLFKDCINLQTLILSSNYLSSNIFISDKAFVTLKSLEYLNLSYNRITSLNSNLLAGLSSLKILDMSHNNMTVIDPRAFYNLNKLQIADFSYNFLTLKSDKFMDEFGPISPFHFVQKSVQNLNLAHNNITEMFRDWTWATDLEKLDLSYNYITSLKASDLEFVIVSDLDLSSNKIEEIHFGEFELGLKTRINPSVHVIIDDNPFLCDCKMFNMMMFLAEEVRASHINYPSITKELKCDEKNITKQNSTCVPINYGHINIGKCPYKCTCRVRPDDQSFLVDCSYRSLQNVSINVNWIPGANVEVDLTGNYLTTIPIGYDQVNVLSLSNNRIEEIPTNMSFNALKELYLDNNLIAEVNSTVLKKLQASKILKNLTLHDNPWRYDCQSIDLFAFIKKMQVKIPELRKVTFDESEIFISEIDYNDICPIYLSWIMIGFLMIAGFILLFGTIFLFYSIYNREIKMWLYARESCMWLVAEDEIDKDKIYDAFISFSYKDEEFIVTELVPKLEQGPNPMKICVNYHSWTAGEWVPQQISDSVHISRRTIIVLSPNYLDSVWGKIEFGAAYNQALNQGRARVIIILYGDIQLSDITDPELKAYLKMNSYVKWGDPWFWEKLRYALPHTRSAVKKTFKNLRPTLKIDNDQKKSISNSSSESIAKSISDTYYI